MARTKKTASAKAKKASAKKTQVKKASDGVIQLSTNNAIDMGAFTMTAVKKFGMRVSVARVSAGVLPKVRRFIAKQIFEVARLSIAVARHARRKTIMSMDVIIALKTIGVDVAATTGNSVCNNGGYQSLNGKMRHAIENRECLVMAKATFERLLRAAVKSTTSSNYIYEEMRLGSGVAETVQLYIEAQLTKLMHSAALVSRAAGRVTLSEDDISIIITMTVNKRL